MEGLLDVQLTLSSSSEWTVTRPNEEVTRPNAEVTPPSPAPNEGTDLLPGEIPTRHPQDSSTPPPNVFEAEGQVCIVRMKPFPSRSKQKRNSSMDASTSLSKNFLREKNSAEMNSSGLSFDPETKTERSPTDSVALKRWCDSKKSTQSLSPYLQAYRSKNPSTPSLDLSRNIVTPRSDDTLQCAAVKSESLVGKVDKVFLGRPKGFLEYTSDKDMEEARRRVSVSPPPPAYASPIVTPRLDRVTAFQSPNVRKSLLSQSLPFFALSPKKGDEEAEESGSPVLNPSDRRYSWKLKTPDLLDQMSRSLMEGNSERMDTIIGVLDRKRGERPKKATDNERGA
jgi:hypothetical protein